MMRPDVDTLELGALYLSPAVLMIPPAVAGALLRQHLDAPEWIGTVAAARAAGDALVSPFTVKAPDGTLFEVAVVTEWRPSRTTLMLASELEARIDA
jgi:hypothetical protein